jgi:membrane protein YdbS with pleckstrin-like domain
MPVLSCPDCGRNVSTLASACPHCGRPMSASALHPPQALGAADEETLWHGTPSPKVLIGRAAGTLAIVVAIPVLAHVAASFTADLAAQSRLVVAGWWIAAAVLVVQAIRLGSALLRIRSTMYTITSQRIVIESGVLSKAVREIDLRTIDDTQFFQSAMHRLMGIGDVTLVSADRTLPTFVLRDAPDPRALRELIRSHAYRVSQRQLFTRQA